MSAYEIESSEVAHEGLFSTIRVDRVRMPDGHVAEREVAEHIDAVAVVPLDDDDHVVCVRQYRHPVGEPLLEIPAGVLDVAEEAPEAAARRELLEEVGLEADELRPLVTFHNSAGWSDESTTVYVARGLREGGHLGDFRPEAEEAHMQVVRLPLAELVEMARSGRLTDAKTLVGLLLVAAERPVSS